MRTSKFIISSFILLIVVSEACSFWHHPLFGLVKTTQPPRCTSEDMKECPGNDKDCTGSNKELRKGGPKDCCDICYTILGKGETCDDPESLYAAVQLLKDNGTLVYSTCTVTLSENEGIVAWALKKFDCLHLVKPTLALGGPGWIGTTLNDEERKKVQRFGPDQEVDSVGFFFACFMKKCKI